MLQKKGVLSETALPEELRLALAQNMHNDMFFQVCAGVKIKIIAGSERGIDGSIKVKKRNCSRTLSDVDSVAGEIAGYACAVIEKLRIDLDHH